MLFKGYRDALYNAQLKVYGEPVEVVRVVEGVDNSFFVRVVFSSGQLKSDKVANGGRLRRDEVYITFYGFEPQKGDKVVKTDGSVYLVSVYDKDDAVLKLDSDGYVLRVKALKK